MKAGNCVVYALRQWWRHGGYIIVRRSRYLWVPHVLWAPPGGLDDARVQHFVPESPSLDPWRIWRAIWFRGRVLMSDKSDPSRCGARPASNKIDQP